MIQVRPDEVSDILRQELSDYKSEAELQEVRTESQADGDGVASRYHC
jgi:F-type H+-transporting ATPase subunit alpha